MATKKTGRAKFVVTRTDEYYIDLGDVPAHVFSKLIEDAANTWIPTLFLGETDYAFGEGGDYGAAANVAIEVTVDD